MIKTTCWTVGTCKCKLFYEWDSESDEATRVHTYVQMVPCEYHKTLSDNLQLKEKCDIVATENRKVGKAQITVEEASNGEIRAEEVGYEFDDQRNIKVKILKEQAKNHKSKILLNLSDLGVEMIEIDG